MLGQIERGQSSPTINILWKISTGLKIPLSFFCKQEEAEYTVAGLDGKDVITEENGGMRAYPLFPFDPVRNVEAFYIELDAGVRHESLPHVAGGGVCISGSGDAESGDRRKGSVVAGKAIHTVWCGYFPHIPQCFG